MTEKSTSIQAADLRRRAEKKARADEDKTLDTLSPEEARQVLHELRVHQIELEMQNEELRRAQVEIEVSRARYFDLYDLAPVGYITLGEKGLILEANLTVATLLGVARGDLVKQPFPRFIRPEHQDIYYRHGKQLFETGAPQVCELQMLRADAAPFWARLEAITAQDADGVSVCRVVVSDITNRKKAEATIRRLAMVVRNSNDAITMQDFDGQITAWNLGAQAMYGYSEKEALQMNIGQLTPPGRELEQKDFTRRLIAGEAITSFETQRVTKDHRILDVWLTVTKLLNDAGTPIGIASTERNVTDRRQAEAKLLELNRHLEDATARANEMALRADAANIAKSEFLANMSHELRTPLNAVIGFSEGLLERTDRHPLNEHQKDRLEKIKASGEYLLQLINGVLDIAKVESGKIDLQITTFDVEPVAREVGDMAEALAKDKPAIRVTLDLEEDMPPMTSDRDKLRQILVNLLGNAIKFTDQGSVTLRVRRNNGSLLFSVEDTGVGISAEYREHLFEQFYQIKQKTHRTLKGTGLGLAISKAFATLLGGTLTFESVEGQGSTFTLTVPLLVERRKGDDRRQVVRRAPDPRPSLPRGQQSFNQLHLMESIEEQYANNSSG